MQTGDMLAIQARDLTRVFGNVTAVDHLDLDVSEGEFFGLLGPNGAGKTSLIRMLVGLSKPTSGSARIFGRDIVKNPYLAKELIGVVPQEFNFDENLTAKEILTYHGGYYGIPGKERNRRADEILSLMEISDKADQPSTKLSGGMKRRLLIGRALMHRPKVLFLDEPTTGVDVQLRRVMWDMLKKLNADGTTIVLTTHYIEEAESLCNRVAIMDRGRIIAMGSPVELKKTSGSTNMLWFDIGKKDVPDLKVIPEVISYTRSGDMIAIRVTDADIAAVRVLDLLKSGGVSVYSMHIKETTLEDVFISLTGRDLRE